MKIYTKKGDSGQTSLFGGPEVSKSDPRLEAYGTIDELNCVLGLALATESWPRDLQTLRDELLRVQNYLFVLGSHLALGDQKMKSHLPTLDETQTQFLEASIDGMQEKLQPLKQFVLPGGSEISAQLHFGRAVARRAERFVSKLNPRPADEILIYLNRLSDFLFVAARLVNLTFGVPDTPWSKNL